MSDQNAMEEEVLERFVRNKLEIERLQAENDTIKAYYKQEEPGPTRRVGKFYVAVTPNTRLDEALVRGSYPEKVYPEWYKTVPDSTKIKRLVGPDTYATLLKTFAPKIEIGLV